MRIAICDDDQNAVLMHKNRIQNFIQKHDIPAVIDIYDNEKVLQLAFDDIKKQPDLLCLDIEIPGINGSALAAKLKEMNCCSEVIFYTDSEIRWYNTDYIEESDTIAAIEPEEERPEKIFLSAITRVSENNNEQLTVSCAGHIRKIDIASVRFFEIRNRIVMVHYDKTSFEFYATLECVEKKMQKKGFLRVHRSFLISKRHVKKAKYNQILLDDDTEIPVGRKYFARVKEALIK